MTQKKGGDRGGYPTVDLRRFNLAGAERKKGDKERGRKKEKKKT